MDTKNTTDAALDPQRSQAPRDHSPLAAGVAAADDVASPVAEEAIHPVNAGAEHDYWTGEFTNRAYVSEGAAYPQFGPAFQYGWESYLKYGGNGKQFRAAEPELERGWDNRRGTSTLDWDGAKHAVRDGWKRVYKAGREASRGEL